MTPGLEGPSDRGPGSRNARRVAAEAPPEKKPSPIEITGFIDAYYGYNFLRPAGDTQLRNFDTKHNQLSLNLIEVALEQKPTPDSRLGFRTDLNFGPATEMVHAFEPGGADAFRSFEQAYVSALAPLGKGLPLDDDDSNRLLSDTTAVLAVTPSLSLMANYDYGRDTVAT